MLPILRRSLHIAVTLACGVVRGETLALEIGQISELGIVEKNHQ